LPEIGTEMFATVASRLTSTMIGWCNRSVAMARHWSCPIASLVSTEFTFGALTTTSAEISVPGNAFCRRL